jgi:uncharacterized protein DUF5676
MNTGTHVLRPLPLALSLAAFLAVAYLACLALALIVPDRGLHTPWLQFYPGFAWTPAGILIGLAESIVYGLFVGAIFAPIYNFFDRFADS